MKRLLVAVLALALTVAIVSPALGGPSIESIGKTADKALRTGKSAQRSARSASHKATAAQTAADGANQRIGPVATLANTANGKADQALARPAITAAGITPVNSPEVTSFPDEPTSAIAYCPAGQRVVSGGGFFNDGGIDGLIASGANSDRSAWFVIGFNNSGFNGTIEAYAYCASGGSAVAAGTSHAKTRREVQRLTRQIAARPAASCSRGYTSANLSWGHKCLRAGQFCKRDKNAEYHRYGYHCPASGHLRRW